MGSAKATAKHAPQPAKQAGRVIKAEKSAAMPHTGVKAAQPATQAASAKTILSSGSSRGHIISIVS